MKDAAIPVIEAALQLSQEREKEKCYAPAMTWA